MKKRIVALGMSVVMALSLAACSSSSAGSSNASQSDTETAERESVSQEEMQNAAAEEVTGDEFFGKSTDFSYMIANGVVGNFRDSYGEVPPLQYAVSKEWDPDGNGNTRKINLEVLTPPAGSEADFANTLVSTGEYPDVMNIQIMSMSASEMYDDGMTLDITDYVMQYMPNYLSFFERHPEFNGRQTILVDGEPRYLCLYHLDESMPDAWGGMMYRSAGCSSIDG